MSKIKEGGAVIDGDLIMTLSKSQNSYTSTFDNPTECDILIGGGGGGTSYSSTSTAAPGVDL